MRVLALTKYGSLAASTRQRFVQYEPALAAAGIQVEYSPLLKNDHLERLVAGKGTSWPSVASSYVGRLLNLATARRYDALWIHCELFPYLPGFAERMARLWRKPIIFDYDDAIYHMYDSASSPLVRRLLGEKLAPLLRSASVCCCGNAYLQTYAARHCEHSIILPTVVDTDIYVPAELGGADDLPVIGWIGSPSTWEYVRPILPLLQEMARAGKARVRIVGAGKSAFTELSGEMQAIDWSEEREVADVQAMDIGIMPLPNDKWARGKSGYKLIQYMACGLPVVTSPVGVNCEIVSHGVNGLIAETAAEWNNALSQLLTSPELCASMGRAGRMRAEASYSLASQAPRLVEVFRSAASSQ